MWQNVTLCVRGLSMSWIKILSIKIVGTEADMFSYSRLCLC